MWRQSFVDSINLSGGVQPIFLLYTNGRCDNKDQSSGVPWITMSIYRNIIIAIIKSDIVNDVITNKDFSDRICQIISLIWQ